MPYRLERSLFIPRPRQEVFTFFADACNLERITPAFLHFHILTPGPVPMKAGTLIDYELRLYGVRFKWRTRIEEFTPMSSFPISSFVDTQVTGPYRKWHHRHEFEEVSGGTEMRDRVQYEMPLGLIGALVRWLFVRRSLDRIFDYRNRAITEIFGK
ncbi:MAG TPA: SRPBCC family protein [Silvibacterium sp.]|jgi:ligand-binding SRPBCC domain-containing protein|nr:SRPBCC family protein [Silvibacterium sp.]